MSLGLQVDDLGDITPGKNVVIPLHSLLKPKTAK